MIKKEEILRDGYDYEDYDKNIVNIDKLGGCCKTKGKCNKNDSCCRSKKN